MTKTSKPTILIIDDNYGAESPPGKLIYDKRSFSRDFGNGPYEFIFSSAYDEKLESYTVDKALDDTKISIESISGVLLDICFGDNDNRLGLDILTSLKKSYPSLPVVMMTSVPRDELLKSCLSIGAVDYLVKPLQPEILSQTLDRYVGIDLDWWLVGQSSSLLHAVDLTAMAAEGGSTSVLLSGESGTGKEIFARYLHRHGKRRDQPFHAIHIASRPETILEGELFGYKKGAFTGADHDEQGLLCRADGSVLFLDEIGDLTPSVQAKLLRVLETREVARIGDGKITKIDVQIVAATNANLSMKVKLNEFRLDLYKRLSGITIHLPSLSERPHDIPLLLQHLLLRESFKRFPDKSPPSLPQDFKTNLLNFDWSGNVRDLYNLVQMIFDLARGRMPESKEFQTAIEHLKGELSENHKIPVTYIESKVIEDYIDPSNLIFLRDLPENVLAAPQKYLDDLSLRELSLLKAAMDFTRHPITHQINRALAAALLLGKPKCSTNDFDRWVERILKDVNKDVRSEIIKKYPDLVVGIKNVSILN